MGLGPAERAGDRLLSGRCQRTGEESFEGYRDHVLHLVARKMFVDTWDHALAVDHKPRGYSGPTIGELLEREGRKRRTAEHQRRLQEARDATKGLPPLGWPEQSD